MKRLAILLLYTRKVDYFKPQALITKMRALESYRLAQFTNDSYETEDQRHWNITGTNVEKYVDQQCGCLSLTIPYAHGHIALFRA